MFAAGNRVHQLAVMIQALDLQNAENVASLLIIRDVGVSRTARTNDLPRASHHSR